MRPRLWPQDALGRHDRAGHDECANQSANAGRLATNVITTFALATLDLRLVLGNDAKRQPQKVIDHIKNPDKTVKTKPKALPPGAPIGCEDNY